MRGSGPARRAYSFAFSPSPLADHAERMGGDLLDEASAIAAGGRLRAMLRGDPQELVAPRLDHRPGLPRRQELAPVAGGVLRQDRGRRLPAHQLLPAAALRV